ncbi:hypothetical protein EHM69_02965 [candidate division KSB1 bacterium]|nr:MAG: hypothetical protein EHM69_02965 [candidate division KSB1 bacterium]
MLLRTWIIVLFIAINLFAEERMVVRHIELEGLRLTRTWVVERELRFQTGDSVSTSDLDGARRRLLNLSIFNHVEVQADSAGNVHVQLTELWPLWPVLSFEFTEGQFTDVIRDPESISEKVTIYAGAQHINFRGNAAQLFGMGQFGAAQGFQLGYRTRWLSSKRKLAVRLAFQNLRVSDRHASVLDSTRRMRDVRYGIDVSTREGAPSRLGLLLTYRGILQEDNFPAQGRHDQTVWCSPYAVIDRRDLEWYPSRGARASVGCDLVSGNIGFVRSAIDLRGYLPLSSGSRPWILALHGSAATSTSNTPAWAHFYHGFNSGLRGYHNEKSESAGYLVGAAELRFPITRETTYDLPMFGKWGQKLPWGISGMLLVEHGELTLDGRLLERLGFGAGFYIRVPYFEILELSASLNREGDTEYVINTGVHF